MQVHSKDVLRPGGEVLVVDDQPENRELLEELLTEAGYTVRQAADGRAALEEVERGLPDCVVLDVMMPRMDGFEVCTHLKSGPRTAFLPVIMLTALSEVGDKVRGLEAGADDFLNKPVRREELLARVRSLVRIKRLREELDSSETVIFTMVRALESRDPRGGGHAQRVAAAGMAVARRLGLGPRERDAVARGGLLHDVGKLGLHDDLLRQPRTEEMDGDPQFRRHPEIGERILLPLRSLASAREVVRHHHERLDGSGYPDRLFGSEISLPAQIVAIANYYDGLVHQASWSPDGAATRLREESRRGRFAREITEAFLESGAAVIGARGDALPDAWSELDLSPDAGRTGTVVVGDDTAANREMFVEVLGEAGFRIVPVSDGEGVLQAVAEGEVDLALVDVMMPGLDGYAVCERLKADPETQLVPVILVTAQRGIADRQRGLDAGADDFLTLPVNTLELLARVRSLLRLRTYSRDLEDTESVVLTLASVLEAKDPFQRGHSARVGDLASRLALEAGLSPEEAEMLRVAGLLHDIGRVGVPDAIADKPADLSAEEMAVVRTHADEGEMLCRPLKTLQGVLPYIRHHHERLDGSGYPDHLRGEDIPLGARILALADAYDALVSDRPQRARLPVEEALRVLAEETRQGFWDPGFFATLEKLVRSAGAR